MKRVLKRALCALPLLALAIPALVAAAEEGGESPSLFAGDLGNSAWTLVIFGVGYLIWFFKARLTETGPAITGKEWFYCLGMMVLIMLGTINIRMAEMKARRQGTLPLVDPNLRSRK